MGDELVTLTLPRADVIKMLGADDWGDHTDGGALLWQVAIHGPDQAVITPDRGAGVIDDVRILGFPEVPEPAVGYDVVFPATGEVHEYLESDLRAPGELFT